jgi:hypothetical protein
MVFEIMQDPFISAALGPNAKHKHMRVASPAHSETLDLKLSCMM